MIRAERIALVWPPTKVKEARVKSLTSVLGVGLLVLGAALVVAVPPLTYSVAAVGGIAVVLITLINPLFGLGALILSVPFSSLAQIAPAGSEISTTEMIIGLILFAWLARLARRRETGFHFGPLFIPMLLFVGLVFLSMTAGSDLNLGAKEMLKWLELLVVYLFVINNVNSRRQIKVMLAVLAIAATAEGLIGFYQFLGRVGPDSFRLGSFLRAYGTFGQPNPFAGYLASVTIPALAIGLVPLILRFWRTPPAPGAMNCALTGHRSVTSDIPAPTRALAASRNPGPFQSRRMQARRPLSLWERARVRAVPSASQRTLKRPYRNRDAGLPVWLGLFFLGAAGVMALAIVMSMSRGAWLGLAAGVAVIGALANRRILIALVILVFVFTLALLAGSVDLLPAQLTERLSQSVDFFRLFDASAVQVTPENWAVVERMANWQAAWGMYERYPWFGVGVGNYGVAYPDFALSGWLEAKGHAHNVYLNMLAEMGIIGLVAYLLLLGSFFTHVFRVARRALRGLSGRDGRAIASSIPQSPSPALCAALSLGMLGALVAISVHNLFDSMFVHGMSAQIGLMLGLVTVVDRLGRKSRGLTRLESGGK